MSMPFHRRKGNRRPCTLAILRCFPEYGSAENGLTRLSLAHWIGCKVSCECGLPVSMSEACGLCKESLATWLRSMLRRNSSICLVGFNMLADLQLGGLLSRIDAGEIDVQWILLQPKLFGTLKWQGGSIKLVDLAGWVGTTLNVVSTWYGDSGDWTERLMQHARREFDPLYRLTMDWLEFGDTVCQGNLHLSAGKTAWEVWRNLYAPTDKKTIVHSGNQPFLLPAFGQSAGRVCIDRQCITQPSINVTSTGEVSGPIYDLDVKSFYPSIYLHSKQPSKLVSMRQSVGPGLCYDLIRDYWCVAKVSLGPCKWPVPVHKHNHTAWEYPPAQTVTAGDELAYYMDNGCVKYVYWIYAYETADYMGEFGDAMIQAREKAERDKNSPQATLIKRISNALWGKFAPRRERWERVDGGQVLIPWGEWTVCDTKNGGTSKRRAIGNEVQECIGLDWPDNCWPAAAAFVTTEARQYLNEVCEKAGRGNVIYRIMDGLHVNKKGFDALAPNIRWGDTLPGALRLVATYDSVRYHGLCSWEHKGGWRISGLPANAIRKGDGLYQAVVFTGPAESDAMGNVDDIWCQQRIFDYVKHAQHIPRGTHSEPYDIREDF